MSKAILKMRDKATGKKYKFVGEEITPDTQTYCVRNVVGDGGVTITFGLPVDFDPDVITVVCLNGDVIRSNATYGGVLTACSYLKTPDTTATVMQYVSSGAAGTAQAALTTATTLNKSYIKADDGTVTYGHLLNSEYTDGLTFPSGIEYAIICSKFAE